MVKGPRYRFMKRDIDEELVWALHCEGVSLDRVRKLVSAGADVNARDTDSAENNVGTVLIHAVMDRRVPVKIVRFLVEQGADVQAFNHDGDSVLMRALWNRNLEPETVELLLSHGVDVDLPNKRGMTPLLFAVGNFFPQKEVGTIIRLLVEAGANVNAADESGDTVIMQALSNVPKLPLAVVEYLVSHGAVIDYFDEDLLPTAVMRCQPEAVAYVVDRGAKLNEVIDDFGTPLDWAEVFAWMQFGQTFDDLAGEKFYRAEAERLSAIFKILVQAGAKRARELV